MLEDAADRKPSQHIIITELFIYIYGFVKEWRDHKVFPFQRSQCYPILLKDQKIESSATYQWGCSIGTLQWLGIILEDVEVLT